MPQLMATRPPGRQAAPDGRVDPHLAAARQMQEHLDRTHRIGGGTITSNGGAAVLRLFDLTVGFWGGKIIWTTGKRGGDGRPEKEVCELHEVENAAALVAARYQELIGRIGPDLPLRMG
ncbi:hypothetical protein [Microbispora sp. NBRC 16548]|uniref:hypothetical protein n=1 Tax=Microbispora sp. NBRC 16548 TaxID=3030994 RepID=UPI0024A4BB7C|nr:hypothetical protein [Microbispora sp. NBRC 16548]GLX06654.1 hypothetical protein Misp03_35810 [Microbispora sp. NBRC 16548]